MFSNSRKKKKKINLERPSDSNVCICFLKGGAYKRTYFLCSWCKIKTLFPGGILLCPKIQANTHDIFTNYVLHYHCLAWLCRSINYRNMKSSSPFSSSPLLAVLTLYLLLSSLLSALYFFCIFVRKEGRAASARACYVGPESVAGRRGPLAPQGQCGCSFWQRVPGGCSTASSQGSLRKADQGSWAHGRTVGTGSGEECLQRQFRTLMTVSAVFYGNKLSRPNPTANG